MARLARPLLLLACTATTVAVTPPTASAETPPPRPAGGSPLTATGSQLWHQDVPGVQETAGESEVFGGAVATGDFDGDGFADLAVGVPSEDVGTVQAAGSVQVFYGTGSGLTATGDQLWHQAVPGMTLGFAETADQFGAALAVGDFDGNGFDDLAIGIPGEDEDASGFTDVGAVQVLYGTASGLAVPFNDYWWQINPSLLDTSETDDRFGAELAAGDFDDDGFDDLAIGVPGEGFGGVDAAGAVQVLYGTLDGLDFPGNDFWHQNIRGIPNFSTADDFFGLALAVGDFDGDGFDDLAIGVPGEDSSTDDDIGIVQVIFGGGSGLSTFHVETHTQIIPGMVDPAEAGDLFGAELAAGDFDDDGFDDLAVAVNGEDVGDAMNAGAMHVLYGSAGGLTVAGNQIWHQDSQGIPDSAGTNEFLAGGAIATGHLDGDRFADVAISAGFEEISGQEHAGAVHVLHGSPAGLVAGANELWHQDRAGIADAAEVGDVFGARLAAGDFDDDGSDDLAIGVLFEDLPGAVNAGAVHVIRGDLFRDGFESGELTGWSATVP